MEIGVHRLPKVVAKFQGKVNSIVEPNQEEEYLVTAG
jgi:hypothetical protein